MENYRDKLKEFEFDYSDNAADIVDTVLYEVENNPDETDVQITIWETIDNYLIYYRDAWDYLMDQGITDFEDAINDYGATTITGIAAYYLTEEVYGLLYKIGLDF